MPRRSNWRNLLFMCNLAVLGTSAWAAVSVVTTEAGITPVGTVDWGVLGAAFSSPAQPAVVAVTGIGGLTITATMDAATPFGRRDQGNGWNGNFGNGEKLLWTNNTIGAMTLEFNAPVRGTGAQIQRDSFGAFTATIEAYDSGNVLLGSFSVPGNSTSAGDDSAIFVGVLSTLIDIKKIKYFVTGSTDFAINGPRIGDAGAIGCGPHRIHGHLSTVPPTHSGTVAHEHHGQHGHTVNLGCPQHAPGHSVAFTEDLGGVVTTVAAPYFVAVNLDGTRNGPEGAPGGVRTGALRRGAVVQLFGSAEGLFLVDSHQDREDARSFTPPASGGLLHTSVLPEVRIGGLPARVLFSGLAPGLTGVWQINVLVPEGAPTGAGIPLNVTFAGSTLPPQALSISDTAGAETGNASDWPPVQGGPRVAAFGENASDWPPVPH